MVYLRLLTWLEALYLRDTHHLIAFSFVSRSYFMLLENSTVQNRHFT